MSTRIRVDAITLRFFALVGKDISAWTSTLVPSGRFGGSTRPVDLAPRASRHIPDRPMNVAPTGPVSLNEPFGADALESYRYTDRGPLFGAPADSISGRIHGGRLSLIGAAAYIAPTLAAGGSELGLLLIDTIPLSLAHCFVGQAATTLFEHPLFSDVMIAGVSNVPALERRTKFVLDVPWEVVEVSTDLPRPRK